ncbi:SDR family NAD(P)-dependent oxidoreductase [Amycolatopsis sp. DR6-1]|uniref:SDR family NAD(P)-dependent oxidoreductase n=1 Tax=Amycolatopsis dendrobii TaxID=2760662 RepID=A0A7W3W6P6_9PSEU|nr:SDR family NAD(P)-dependent oxidoreductase [Amycolatopsis dendrobii]
MPARHGAYPAFQASTMPRFPSPRGLARGRRDSESVSLPLKNRAEIRGEGTTAGQRRDRACSGHRTAGRQRESEASAQIDRDRRARAAVLVRDGQHVHAAQAVLPSMLARGECCLPLTASAAGLLGVPGDAPYSVTKHAAVALAEWLAITYRPRGVRISALCPLGVRTALLEPEDVADAVVRRLARDEFLILPHESVRETFAREARAMHARIDQTAARGS